MTYSGAVKVGGPADVHELQNLMISKVAVGPMDNNAYLLRCTNTGELLLIDAANEPETLLNLIGGEPLATIVTTHRHGDHWQALEAVAKATGAEVILNGNTLEGSNEQYISMVLEKTVAGPARNPDYPNCAPSSEATPYWLIPGHEVSWLMGEAEFGQPVV